ALTSAVYEGTTDPVRFYDSVVINGKTYTNVFYLKPGEAATFAEMPDETQYYVQELGVGTDYYEEVVVNDVKIDGHDVTPKDGVYPTSVATVGNRARVTYSNHCSDKNLNDLRITKQLAEGCVDDGSTFEFRVQLENAEGVLAPYSVGEYYIQDANGDYYHYVNGKLVNNGKTPIVASVSGNNGTIAGIPAGFTIVITNLLADTDFHVEEIRNPAGWEFQSKTLEEGTYAESTLKGTDWSGNEIVADGQIILDHDAKVTITNKGNQRIVVNKDWESGDLVSQHGNITVALFTRGEGGELTLVEGSVRTLVAPNTQLVYETTNPALYVVREVVVSGSTVTPVGEGEKLAVSGESTQVGSGLTDTYVVTYEQGDVQTTDGEGNEITPQRTDTITNTMASLTVNKTDINNAQLAGATFSLLKEDKKTAVPGYESFTSTDAENGNLLSDVRLPNGTYYLVETNAPAGYNLLEHMLKIVVDADGISMKTDDTVAKIYTDQTATNNLVYTFSVANNTGAELPMTGGTGTWPVMAAGMMLVLAGAVLLGRRLRMMF
ncbi:MAG: LPXTG cell wall anchor domain-containing protein, partial [Atopobiaceae bacterium]|nr:LPXTG cell wall anchor domain-containing protein [Atopobiaceae bacterium]